ncbi:MAG: hypothetical protein KKF30_07695 [Proteobacteria bacterium]|nr:hypothetical protein [Pseudomonadota bacterium]MBU4469868.1 hypothetical protein [Pseudomonadota bacterium]MCG2751554.1 hypothetical protein [Desulfobacteraceae bacterium]
MDRSKQIFSVGLFIGIAVTVLFCLVFAPRYTVDQSSGHAIKLDKWTGETWHFSRGNWIKTQKIDQDWKKIDEALFNALNLKPQKDQGGNYTSDLLKILREKYPILEGVPNEDILERINIVYSKAILTDMYLKNIEKIHEAQVEHKGRDE